MQEIRTTLAPGAPWPYFMVPERVPKKHINPRQSKLAKANAHKRVSNTPSKVALRTKLIEKVLRGTPSTSKELAELSGLSYTAVVWRMRQWREAGKVVVANQDDRVKDSYVAAIYKLTEGEK